MSSREMENISFTILDNETKFWKKRKHNIVATKEVHIQMFFRCFSREWKTGERYKAKSIGDRAEPCPTPTLMLKEGKIKSFQQYWVFLPTR